MTDADGTDYPWRREEWAAHADAANRGMNGQGYIVHSAMLAARSNSRLTWAILGLMVVQIATAVWAKLW